MGKYKKIPLSNVQIDADLKKSVCRVIDSGSYILGKECAAFEEEFADFMGTKYAILIGSGTAAIWLSLISLGVKPKDEIIVPALTAFPTIEPILTVGAKPVFVDIDNTYTIDPKKIEQDISKNTVGIIPVHLYGHPANMGEITRLAKKHKLFVLEDCCQAHGAKFIEHKVGSIGIAGCFSFYPSKNLTVCGDGGAVTTNDKSLNKKIRMLRDHGRSSKYVHNILGYNERFNEIQASIGRYLLRKLDESNERRRQIAALYRNKLNGLPIVLPAEKDWAYHVYHMFVVRIKKRDKIIRLLSQSGISTGIHYPIPAHLQPPIIRKYGKSKLPLTEEYCCQILSLPIYPAMKDREVECVCRFLIESLENAKIMREY